MILDLLKEKKHPYMVIAIMLVAIFGVYIWGNNDAAKISATEETQVAQVTYTPLAPLPGQNVASGDIFGYLQNLIFLGIGIAIVLAVLVIVVAGIQYMASDVFTKKEEARNRMTMALAGLIIAFGGYLLLKTINPELVVFKFSPKTTDIQTKKPIEEEKPKFITKDISKEDIEDENLKRLTDQPKEASGGVIRRTKFIKTVETDPSLNPFEAAQARQDAINELGNECGKGNQLLPSSNKRTFTCIEITRN